MNTARISKIIRHSTRACGISLAVLLCMACSVRRNVKAEPYRLSKLERLRQEPPVRIMDRYDLSGDSLTEFPDLSMYAIRSLDLSHNLLDTIRSERLPLGLVNLDMSHNRLSGKLTVKYLALPHLHELDLSYNALTAISLTNYVDRIILSHNKLGWKIELGEIYRIPYVDISYNENIYKAVRFDPEKVDTLVCEGLPGGDRVAYSILNNSAEGEAAGWEKFKRALRLEMEAEPKLSSAKRHLPGMRRTEGGSRQHIQSDNVVGQEIPAQVNKQPDR